MTQAARLSVGWIHVRKEIELLLLAARTDCKPAHGLMTRYKSQAGYGHDAEGSASTQPHWTYGAARWDAKHLVLLPRP